MKKISGHLATLLLAVMGGCSQQQGAPQPPAVENTGKTEATADTIDDALIDAAAAEKVSPEEIASITDRMTGLAVRLSAFVLRITESGEDIARPSGTAGNTARAAYRVYFLLSKIEPQLKQNGVDGETLSELSEQLETLDVTVRAFEGTGGEVEGAHSRLTLLTSYFERLYKSEVGALEPYSYSLDELVAPNEAEVESSSTNVLHPR